MHLASEVLRCISYRANVNSSNTVKKGKKNLGSVYCVLDLTYTESFFLPTKLTNYPKAVLFHDGETDT